MTQKKLEKDSKYNEMDANKDGVISDIEIDSWQQTEEVKRINRKQMHQRNMAWVSLGSMLVFTVIMFTPLIPDSRISLVVVMPTKLDSFQTLIVKTCFCDALSC